MVGHSLLLSTAYKQFSHSQFEIADDPAVAIVVIFVHHMVSGVNISYRWNMTSSSLVELGRVVT